MVELSMEITRSNDVEGFTVFISQPILSPRVKDIELGNRVVPLNMNSKGESQEITGLNHALCEIAELSRNDIINKDIIPELRIILKGKKLELSEAAQGAIEELREKGIDVIY